MENMPEHTNSHMPHKNLLGVGIFIIILFGLGFILLQRNFASQISQATNEIQELKELVQNLQPEGTEIEEIDEVEENKEEVTSKVEDTKEKTEAKVTETNNKVPFSSFMPAVFNPAGQFSPHEKFEIEKKIIEPYRTYNYYMPSELGSIPVSMMIKKNPLEKIKTHGFTYDATVVWSTGTHGWLFGENNTLEYWKPECMGECEYPKEFKEKYPQLF